MKRIIAVVAFVTLFCNSAFAVDASFVRLGGGDKNTNGTLANEAGLTYSRNYYVNPGNYSTDKMSSVIYFGSVTFSNVTFSTNAYNDGSGYIAITGHGLTMGIPVSITATSGKVPPPLVTGTTYFAIPVTADIVELATTAAKAQASDFIIMGSSKPADGTQLYTLKVASTTVCLSTFVYSVSNDGTSFVNLTSSAPAVYGGQSWAYDFSTYNYTTLRLAITPPSDYCAVKVKASMNLRQ